MPALRRCLPLCLSLCLSAAAAAQWTPNLKDADIQELIRFVAEATGTTIVVDPRVKGTVQVVSPKPLDDAELYHLFLSILDVHGFTAVRSGNVVRVVQAKDARTAPVPAAVAEGGSGATFITQVLHLRNVSAVKLIPVLRPLVPQQSHLAAYAPANAIIVSDNAANIARIREVIEDLDRGAVTQTEVVTLKHGVATDVARMINEVSQAEAKQAGTAEAGVRLVADRRTNSLLLSGGELERARVKRLIQHLDAPPQQTGNVRVIYLEYADAVETAEVLTNVMQNINRLNAEGEGRRDSDDGAATIEADASTNALIITADSDEMQSLEGVIQRLDIRRAQVLVEAIIAELEIIDGQDLGVQWLFRNEDGAFGSNIISGTNRTSGIAEGLLNPNNGSDGGNLDIDRGSFLSGLAGTPGLSLGWGRLRDDLDIAIILSALDAQTNANILSTPSLLTLDNQEAYITVGQEVPFITGSYSNTGSNSPDNPFQTIRRENVGITLKVTPHVNAGDAVVLDIAQEVSSLTGAGMSAALLASDIITNTRKVQTKVLAADGSTVVLGGLIKEDLQDSQQKIPLLGDIPWLGRLFRSDSVSLTQSNLLVFIKPTIIREDAALDGATAAKYRHLRTQQLLRLEAGVDFIEDENIPLLPEWEEQLRQLEALRGVGEGEVIIDTGSGTGGDATADPAADSEGGR